MSVDSRNVSSLGHDEAVVRHIALDDFLQRVADSPDVEAVSRQPCGLVVAVPGHPDAQIFVPIDQTVLFSAHPRLLGNSSERDCGAADIAVALFEALRFHALPHSKIEVDADGHGFSVSPSRSDGELPWMTVPAPSERLAVPRPTEGTLYEIDGALINSWEEFFHVVGKAVGGPGAYFGAGLDSLSDCLAGGFGTPDDGFAFTWIRSARSRSALGYEEARRLLRNRLATAACVNRRYIREDLLLAENDRGPTPFDWIVEVFDESGVPLLLA